MAFNRKGLSAGTSGTIAPLSDVEQNNLSGQHSQEKFTRWASEPPREGKAEAPNEGVAVTASDGNQVVLTVKDLHGGQGSPCLTAAGPDFSQGTCADRDNSLRGKCGRKAGMILYARKVKEERMGQN